MANSKLFAIFPLATAAIAAIASAAGALAQSSPAVVAVGLACSVLFAGAFAAIAVRIIKEGKQ